MQHRNWLFGKNGALFSAASSGDLKLVAELIKDGADVNVASLNGYTALHRAAQNGHFEIVKHLLAKGADARRTSVDNKTPLIMAVENSQSKIAELLRQAT